MGPSVKFVLAIKDAIFQKNGGTFFLGPQFSRNIGLFWHIEESCICVFVFGFLTTLLESAQNDLFLLVQKRVTPQNSANGGGGEVAASKGARALIFLYFR